MALYTVQYVPAVQQSGAGLKIYFIRKNTGLVLK
jgi:hypothetical protein